MFEFNPGKKTTIVIYSIGAVLSFFLTHTVGEKAIDHFKSKEEPVVKTVIVTTVPTEKVIIRNNTPTTTTVNNTGTYNPGVDDSVNTCTHLTLDYL